MLFSSPAPTPAMSVVHGRNSAHDEHSALEELIEENVLLQMNHLRTHPSVAGALARDALALSGWVYDIAHGIVRMYDEERHMFCCVNPR
jgi:carbonic anhydrase